MARSEWLVGDRRGVIKDESSTGMEEISSMDGLVDKAADSQSFIKNGQTSTLLSLAILRIKNSLQLVKSENTSLTSENDELIFGRFTPVALLVISVGTIILAICTAIACYIDFANMNRGIGKLSVCPETEGAPYPDILSTYGSRESERRHLLREGSSEETAPAKIDDLSAEARQLPKVMMAPGRQDAQARQARIIEAIYNASGREVPPQYRSKEPITGKIDIPERIQQTLEGIADKDVDETGSPVVSPSNFARQYSLPPPVKSKDDDRTGLTTTATLREIWTRPLKTQTQATTSPAGGLDASQRALQATPGPLGISHDAAASSTAPGMESVRQQQASAQPHPGSERQRQAQVRSFPSGSASGATPAATQIWQTDQGGKK